jgi:exopolysaccharide biosynthesis polyprenyl glycosylphosphotransferase
VAATQFEHRPARVLRSGRPDTPPARSPDVEERLQARRRQIASLRRLFVCVDATVAGCVAGLALAGGQAVAAGTALAVFLAVTAHVCAADGPRSIVALRSVVKLATVLGALACVLAAVAGSRSAGREIVLGAASVSLALVTVRVLARMPVFAARLALGRRRRLIVGDPQALESTTDRRTPAVEAGEVILVVTRAERSSGDATSRAHTPDVGRTGENQRREHDERSGPTGVVERVVRTALDSSVERVTVIPGRSWRQRQLRELSWLLEGTGIDIVISTELDGIAPHRVGVVHQDGRLMIKVGSASPRGTQALVKGMVDRVAAAVLLMLSMPLLVAIAAAVRIESAGPALFHQTRVRERGLTFTMHKFRTMRVDAEQQLSELEELNMHGASRPLFKIENDPRITRVGHVLRKTSLDELPQLFNVLRGQMSLIGPRPALPLEVEMYDYVARRRLAVKPGMTGLWQVSGRSRLTWDESIGFDLDYVDNWSPGTDAAIAVRTFRAVVTKDGAF